MQLSNFYVNRYKNPQISLRGFYPSNVGSYFYNSPLIARNVHNKIKPKFKSAERARNYTTPAPRFNHLNLNYAIKRFNPYSSPLSTPKISNYLISNSLNYKNNILKNFYSNDLRSNSSQNHHNVETTMTILSDRVIVDMTEESDKESEMTMEEASQLANSLHHINNPYIVEEEEIPLDGNTPSIDINFEDLGNKLWPDRSPIPEFPFWNDKLASRSEEIVKADQAPEKPLKVIMEESVAYFQRKYNPPIQSQKDDYNSTFEE